MFYVDFFIPDAKIVIEVHGPYHYIKPELTKQNLYTEFKGDMIRKLGYDYIEIPFNTIELEGKSIDLYLIEQLEKTNKILNFKKASNK